MRRFHRTLLLHSIILFQYQLSKNADVDDKKKMEEKILSILSDPKATFDPDHALILSQMHGFSRGTLFLYEKKGLHDQVQFVMLSIQMVTIHDIFSNKVYAIDLIIKLTC